MKWLRLAALLVVAASSACGSDDAESSPPVGLEEGNLAPALEGIDAAGAPFTLDGAGQPQVVVFYSTAACGLCRVQLENLQAHLPAYEREGARVVAVSLDQPETSRAFRDEAGIGYPLISVDSATFQAWVPSDSGLGAPLPATYILDGSGVIQFRYVGRNASDRTSDPAMISILSGINGQ
jgi:mycoredoxin-dependent peroxiredoxin